MILISILLIGLFNLFVTRKIFFHRLIDIVLLNFLLVCSNIVVTFEISSLLGLLNSQTCFIIIQSALLLLAVIFNLLYKKNPPNNNIALIDLIHEWWSYFSKNKVLLIFLISITLVYVFLAYLSIVFPQNTSDALYNHLSRIGHWLQQGSLKPYESFNPFSITYPYNNSLLMMWSVLFTHSDRLVGFVQWFASIMLAMSIYGLATLFKFKKPQALFSALVFLTFPIVIFQSTTAQNDLLATAFFLVGLFFFIAGFQNGSRSRVLFSALSIALAVGTKQYIVFTIPGFLLIFLFFMLQKKNKLGFKLAGDFIILTLLFTFILGSYTYIQNYIFFNNPTGIRNNSNFSVSIKETNIPRKLAFNSTRFFTQFISCEGLPLPIEDSCLNLKGTILRRLLTKPGFNLESNEFLLEPDCSTNCFSFSRRFPYNEESAWFGFLSWILITYAVIYLIIESIRQKALLPVLVLITSFIFFLFISIFKDGWDPYIGRYLIISVALLVPFTAGLYSLNTRVKKVLMGLVVIISIFVMVYSVLSNDSRPLVGKRTLADLQDWTQPTPSLKTRMAFQIEALFLNEHSVFEYSYSELKTINAKYMIDPLKIVSEHVPLDSTLGILAKSGIFLDYPFFGDRFTRKIFNLVEFDNQDQTLDAIRLNKINYLLVSPKISFNPPQEVQKVVTLNDWQIYVVLDSIH